MEICVYLCMEMSTVCSCFSGTGVVRAASEHAHHLAAGDPPLSSQHLHGLGPPWGLLTRFPTLSAAHHSERALGAAHATYDKADCPHFWLAMYPPISSHQGHKLHEALILENALKRALFCRYRLHSPSIFNSLK